MKRRNLLIGTLCVYIIILLLTPNVDASNANGQKVAGISEPGPREYKDPAVSANEDILAIVYAYKGAAGSAIFEIRMALSFDGGFSFNALHPKVSTNDNTCRHPDVLVTKRYIEEDEFNVIYIVWQELNDDIWQINSKSYYIDTDDSLTLLDDEQYISERGAFRNALYPRIEGSYLPYEIIDGFHMDSATSVMAVWQQENGNDGIYRIMCSYIDFQTHFSIHRSSHSSSHWTIPFEWPEQPLEQTYSIEHPSVDVFSWKVYCSQYSYPYVTYSVSYEQKVDVGGGQYSYNGNVNNAKDSYYYTVDPDYPSYYFLVSTIRMYNLNSNGWCYPDVAYYQEDEVYYQTVAFQDPDDGCAKVDATGYAYADPEMTIGVCKTPTLRGISLDHIDPEYFFTEDDGIRDQWTNPGGITVIWRSDVTIPNTQNTYGIDSINLEYKNNHLRISHEYWMDTDDDDGDQYVPVDIFHETSNSVDEYIDIKSVPDYDSHVSYKRNNGIWYFSLISYV